MIRAGWGISRLGLHAGGGDRLQPRRTPQETGESLVQDAVGLGDTGCGPPESQAHDCRDRLITGIPGQGGTCSRSWSLTRRVTRSSRPSNPRSFAAQVRHCRAVFSGDTRPNHVVSAQRSGLGSLVFGPSTVSSMRRTRASRSLRRFAATRGQLLRSAAGSSPVRHRGSAPRSRSADARKPVPSGCRTPSPPARTPSTRVIGDQRHHHEQHTSCDPEEEPETRIQPPDDGFRLHPARSKNSGVNKRDHHQRHGEHAREAGH